MAGLILLKLSNNLMEVGKMLRIKIVVSRNHLVF